MRIFVLLSLIVCGCFSPPNDDGDGKPAGRFIARPVQVVVSELFSDECVNEIESGWAFIRDKGVRSSITSAPSDFPGFREIPVPGTVAVMPGELESGPGHEVLGEARIARAPVLGGIIAGLITLDFCDAQAFAHELGHVLGLVHKNSPQNLMHEDIVYGGWELTQEQVFWISD